MVEIIILSVFISYIGGVYVGRNWEKFTNE